jgi:hypothetical protein
MKLIIAQTKVLDLLLAVSIGALPAWAPCLTPLCDLRRRINLSEGPIIDRAPLRVHLFWFRIANGPDKSGSLMIWLTIDVLNPESDPPTRCPRI